MEKLIYKHQKFIHTLAALERSVKTFSRTDIDQDIRENLVASIIKHFEMCYEASWKFLKCYIEVRYAEKIDSPKKVFRQCFILGIINEATTKELLDIAEARNATTHDYDAENAQEICQRVSDYFITFTKITQVSIDVA